MTPKQERFCSEYVIDLNATQAAIRAGYSEKTANRIASENLSKPDIQNRISKLTADATERNNITVDRVLQEFAAIAFLDPIDLFNEDGSMKQLAEMPESARRAIGGIEIKEYFEGRGDDVQRINLTKIKIIDKRAALGDLGKYLGMFIDRVDHSSADGSMSPKDPAEYAKAVRAECEDIMKEFRRT